MPSHLTNKVATDTLRALASAYPAHSRRPAANAMTPSSTRCLTICEVGCTARHPQLHPHSADAQQIPRPTRTRTR